MKRILVGFDGSEGAEKALNKAMTLIDSEGELFILAVTPSGSDRMFLDEETSKNLKKKASFLIDSLVSDLGEHGFSIKGLVMEGDAPSVIIDVANRLDVDLIVLGTKGFSKIGRFLIGGVANKVIQYANKPVMVVR